MLNIFFGIVLGGISTIALEIAAIWLVMVRDKKQK